MVKISIGPLPGPFSNIAE